jgi:excisionase family DNA binding protein
MAHGIDGKKLNLLQAAELLGVSSHTIRSWTRQKKIPFYRCGRRIVFCQGDIEAFLDRCRVEQRESE